MHVYTNISETSATTLECAECERPGRAAALRAFVKIHAEADMCNNIFKTKHIYIYIYMYACIYIYIYTYIQIISIKGLRSGDQYCRSI